MSETRTCINCEGEARILGVLGWTTHYHCRDCGAEFQVDIKPQTKTEQKRKARYLRAQRREKARIQKFGYGV